MFALAAGSEQIMRPRPGRITGACFRRIKPFHPPWDADLSDPRESEKNFQTLRQPMKGCEISSALYCTGEPVARPGQGKPCPYKLLHTSLYIGKIGHGKTI